MFKSRGLFMVTLTGRGSAPRDIVATATGRGSVIIGDARLAVLGPANLTTILQGALRGPADQLAQSIRQGLLAHRATEPTLLLPARSLEIDVKNGVASLSPVGVEQSDGQVVGAVAVDLKAMGYSAQWRVEAKADPLPPPPGWTTTVTASGAIVPRKPFVPLPPVTLTSTGSLLAPSAPKVDVSTDALEREVAVRKLERDLEDLERLRKLDEERAKEEGERRRAAESTGPSLPPGSVPPSSAPGVIPGSLPAAAQGSTTASPGSNLGSTPGALTAPLGPGADPSTDAAAVPDTVDPSLRPRPAAPASSPASAPVSGPVPAPKPAIRPMNSDEHRKIFGGG
jgi:hypothetical protein